MHLRPGHIRASATSCAPRPMLRLPPGAPLPSAALPSNPAHQHPAAIIFVFILRNGGDHRSHRASPIRSTRTDASRASASLPLHNHLGCTPAILSMAHAADSASTSSSPALHTSNCCQKPPLPTIPHRNRHIPQQPLPSRPLHRRTLEPSLKLRRIHPRQPLQRRIHQLLPRQHSLPLRHRSPPVPRTNILADIAPKHLPPHLLPQLLCNRTLLLNRQISNTPSSIHLPLTHQRSRRTSIDTPRTTPTPIRSIRTGTPPATGSEVTITPNSSQEPIP